MRLHHKYSSSYEDNWHRLTYAFTLDENSDENTKAAALIDAINYATKVTKCPYDSYLSENIDDFCNNPLHSKKFIPRIESYIHRVIKDYKYTGEIWLVISIKVEKGIEDYSQGVDYRSPKVVRKMTLKESENYFKALDEAIQERVKENKIPVKF